MLNQLLTFVDLEYLVAKAYFLDVNFGVSEAASSLNADISAASHHLRSL
jgi:hypothetical protein